MELSATLKEHMYNGRARENLRGPRVPAPDFFRL